MQLLNVTEIKEILPVKDPHYHFFCQYHDIRAKSVAQRVFIKFFTTEGVKLFKILKRLKAQQFEDNILKKLKCTRDTNNF